MDLQSILTCKCEGSQICFLCRVLVVATLLIGCGIVGFVLGRKRRGKNET